MPLLIRELNIRVNVGQVSASGGNSESTAAADRGKKNSDAALVKRALEDMMRIEAGRKER